MNVNTANLKHSLEGNELNANEINTKSYNLNFKFLAVASVFAIGSINLFNERLAFLLVPENSPRYRVPFFD